MLHKIARAIDCGHGVVKYSRKVGEAIVFHDFPAVAIPSSSRDLDVPGMPRLRTLISGTNGREYLVGPDTQAMQQSFGGRELLESYPTSERYIVLMLGALAYMREPEIDRLVLALPLSTYSRERGRLEEIWTKRVVVPSLYRAISDTTVNIRRVTVVPQPLGAYMAGVKEGKVQCYLGNVLAIDPGFHTLDWVVMSPRGAALMHMSGALQGGVHSLMVTLAKALEPEVGRSIENLAPIEEALRTGQPAFLWGHAFPLTPHMAKVEAAVDGMVTEMMARLGQTTQIRQVIVAGGGAHLFAGVLRRRLGDFVNVLDDPAMANVRGFQIISESLARRSQSAAVSA